MVGEEGAWQAPDLLAEKCLGVQDEHATGLTDDVLNAFEVAGRLGQIGKRRHKAGAKLARACRGKSVELPGNVTDVGREDRVDVLAKGSEQPRVKRCERAVCRRGNAVLLNDTMEGYGEVLAQDAIAGRRAHALAGEVPALGRHHGGKRPQGALPGTDNRKLRKLAKRANDGSAHALQRRTREVAPRALVGRGKALKANLLVDHAGTVVTIYQRKAPLLAGQGS